MRKTKCYVFGYRSRSIFYPMVDRIFLLRKEAIRFQNANSEYADLEIMKVELSYY